MRIALVSPYDYPFPGGVTQHIHYLDKHFRELGHQVKIIAPCAGPEPENLPDNVVVTTNKVISIPFSGSTARIPYSPLVNWRVRKALHEEDFDILHAHEPMTLPVPIMALTHSRAVNVGTFHAYRDTHVIYKYGRRIFQPFFDKLQGKIAVSEAAKDTVARYFGGEFVIIPNGIDVDRFGGEHVSPIEQYLDGRPNILFVGRLEPRKGFRYLLQALPYIKEEFPKARLIVVGAYRKDEVTAHLLYVREHHLTGVKFVGRVSDDDLPRYYRTCDVFCAPSTGFESFGIVLLEAMAAGKPAVATDIPGYRDLLANGKEGLLAEPKNERALAQAIIHILKNPDLQRSMGAEGRAKARQYSWRRVALRVLEFYEELLTSKKNEA
ncbi:MAG: glycosyltransferase family 4 protein [Anaerolineae bacterium]|nr:glycosyltransferase family 4 protein [Anaerolineae bacterium]